MRRFVFRPYANDSNKPSRTMDSIHPSRQQAGHSAILRMPNNDSMNLTASLVDKLQTGNPRSGINWSSGIFMHDLPKRLEHSDALSAATHAFTLACPCVEVTYSLMQQRLRSYVFALKATRLALTHTEEACSFSTMCAVYFLWICQVCDAIDTTCRMNVRSNKSKELDQCH